MATFDHSLARFAVWNLAGNTPFNPGAGIEEGGTKAENQAKGLALLDADFITLVEVSPISHISWLAGRLADFGLTYEVTIDEQPTAICILDFCTSPGSMYQMHASFPTPRKLCGRASGLCRRCGDRNTI